MVIKLTHNIEILSCVTLSARQVRSIEITGIPAKDSKDTLRDLEIGIVSSEPVTSFFADIHETAPALDFQVLNVER